MSIQTANRTHVGMDSFIMRNRLTRTERRGVKGTPGIRKDSAIVDCGCRLRHMMLAIRATMTATTTVTVGTFSEDNSGARKASRTSRSVMRKHETEIRMTLAEAVSLSMMRVPRQLVKRLNSDR